MADLYDINLNFIMHNDRKNYIWRLDNSCLRTHIVYYLKWAALYKEHNVYILNRKRNVVIKNHSKYQIGDFLCVEHVNCLYNGSRFYFYKNVLQLTAYFKIDEKNRSCEGRGTRFKGTEWKTVQILLKSVYLSRTNAMLTFILHFF